MTLCNVAIRNKAIGQLIFTFIEFFFLPAGPKALVCDQCGAQFSKEDALEAHRQTHTGTTLLALSDHKPNKLVHHNGKKHQ